MKIGYFIKILAICTFGVLLFYLFFVPGHLWMPFADDLPDFLTQIPIWTLVSQSGLLILGGLAVTVTVIIIKELI